MRNIEDQFEIFAGQILTEWGKSKYIKLHEIRFIENYWKKIQRNYSCRRIFNGNVG